MSSNEEIKQLIYQRTREKDFVKSIDVFLTLDQKIELPFAPNRPEFSKTSKQ